MILANDLTSEVQDLVWALVDEQATDDQVRTLETLLLQSDEARRVYVRCMQMHADLYCLFGGKQAPPPRPRKKAAASKRSVGLTMEEHWPADCVAVEA
jgi:hypothetical protein